MIIIAGVKMAHGTAHGSKGARENSHKHANNKCNLINPNERSDEATNNSLHLCGTIANRAGVSVSQKYVCVCKRIYDFI